MTMWDFYERYFVPFGNLLTEWRPSGPRRSVFNILERDAVAAMASISRRLRVSRDDTSMGRGGIHVDAAGHLQAVERQAEEDKEAALETFRSWCVSVMGEDGRLFNPASSKQIQTLLFGGSANQKTGEILEREREFDVDLPASELPRGRGAGRGGVGDERRVLRQGHGQTTQRRMRYGGS